MDPTDGFELFIKNTFACHPWPAPLMFVRFSLLLCNDFVFALTRNGCLQWNSVGSLWTLTTLESVTTFYCIRWADCFSIFCKRAELKTREKKKRANFFLSLLFSHKRFSAHFCEAADGISCVRSFSFFYRIIRVFRIYRSTCLCTCAMLLFLLRQLPIWRWSMMCYTDRIFHVVICLSHECSMNVQFTKTKRKKHTATKETDDAEREQNCTEIDANDNKIFSPEKW